MPTNMQNYIEPNTVLDRRMGKLVNKEVININGDSGFNCQCDCGQWRKVKRKVFNAGSVTCCKECVKKGGWVQMSDIQRAQISLDSEPLALLGFDLSVKGSASGAALRRLIGEFGELVREATADVHLIEPEWMYLRQRVLAEPDLLTSTATPKGRLLRIVGDKYGIGRIVLAMNPLHILAVLSALRWAVLHPEEKGFWKPSVRIGDEG